jgi:hypothetical protein
MYRVNVSFRLTLFADLANISGPENARQEEVFFCQESLAPEPESKVFLVFVGSLLRTSCRGRAVVSLEEVATTSPLGAQTGAAFLCLARKKSERRDSRCPQP